LKVNIVNKAYLSSNMIGRNLNVLTVTKKRKEGADGRSARVNQRVPTLFGYLYSKMNLSKG
jgi:hypothetical protein